MSFVRTIFSWVEEMLEIEKRGVLGEVSKAAGSVYSWMRKEGLTGFGMPLLKHH